MIITELYSFIHKFGHTIKNNIQTMNKRLIITLLLLQITCQIFACTTAIISGKYTKDGKAIIWKLRDTESFENKLGYFTDGKYPYFGLINANDPAGKDIWGGYNQSGFAIMNSASFNTNLDKPTDFKDQEGVIMRMALKQCKTLEDFEEMLKKLPKPMGLNANFGVIDANGGCAYYETDNNTFVKFDANDPKVAPNGYIIRTNYSYIGKKDIGYGFIRNQTAVELFNEADAENNFSINNFIKNFSRTLKHSLLKTDYSKITPSTTKGDFINSSDFIVRHGSASSIIIKGVKEKEDPKNTCFWSMISFPLTTVTIPVWMTKNGNLPSVICAKDKESALLAKYALSLKDRIYPIKRSSGFKYMDLSVYQNSVNGGIRAKINKIEDQILLKANKLIDSKNLRDNDIIAFYKWVDEYVEREYKAEFNL
jgi:hypothetical protein